MKRKISLPMPTLLLMVVAFFGISTVAHADSLYQKCLNGDKEACRIIQVLKELRPLNEQLSKLLKTQVRIIPCDPLWCDPVIPEEIEIPPCDPRYCDPPEFIDSFLNPEDLREELSEVFFNFAEKLEHRKLEPLSFRKFKQ